MPRITGFHGRPIEITQSGQTWNMARDAMIVGSAGFDIKETASNTVLNIAGQISTFLASVQSLADNTTVTTAASSVLTGSMVFFNDVTTLDLRGTLIGAPQDDLAAVWMMIDTEATITNRGSITGENGITFEGPRMSVVNEAGATIGGADIGILSLDDAAVSIVNRGHIYGFGDVNGNGGALVLGDGDARVVNRGSIIGTINLGSGDDVFDNRRGLVQTDIAGGRGDDVLVTDSADIYLFEEFDAGFDTVRSTVSYTLNEDVEALRLIGRANVDALGTDGGDLLIGNRGNNLIQGFGGRDQLIGGAGRDRLEGGPGDDAFVFQTGDGRDVVTDFEFGSDIIFIPRLKAVTDFDDLMNNHIRFAGDDLVIDAGKDVLRIKAWGDEAILDDYFLLAPED